MTTYPCGCVYAGGSPFCVIHELHLRGPCIKCPDCKGTRKKRDWTIWDWLFGNMRCQYCSGTGLVAARQYPPLAPPATKTCPNCGCKF